MATGKALAAIPLPTVSRRASDTLPVEQIMVLAHGYGPFFHLPQSKPRTLVVSTLALANEARDDQRFDKVAAEEGTAVRLLAGDGLFTAWTQELN